MSASISLSRAERNVLLDYYRSRFHDPDLRLRAHIILLLADGHSWALIAALLFCSTRTIARWQARFHRGGLPALFGRPRGPQPLWGSRWVGVLVAWVTQKLPADFGFLRSRWCCAALVIVLLEVHHVRVSRETVRRWLHQGGLVWRRPRPVVGPKDPDRAAKLHRLRALLADLPADETAVFQDEVDVHSNPKIGSMWMRRGAQAEMPTPGTNQKRYLAGSLHWRTGWLIATEAAPGGGRDAELFVRHLEDLRHRLRRYRTIHVICDNARAHDCQAVREYLGRWGHRIVIHYLPKYAPEANPIERLWWHLHDEITRNHRCRSLEELLHHVFTWLEKGRPFAIETSVYPKPTAA
jgi:putative transposase